MPGLELIWDRIFSLIPRINEDLLQMELRTMKITARNKIKTLLLGAAFILCLPPGISRAADMCPTPDGYTFLSDGGKRDGDGGGKGIGGTGQRLAERGKGIGGTGEKLPGTISVYGRITGFGSICVNGLEITYGKDTPVTEGSGNASVSDLKIGQIVSVVADRVSDKEYTARHVDVQYKLSGLVEKTDPAKGLVTIGGQNAYVAGADLKGIDKGDPISISGIRDSSGTVLASYIKAGVDIGPRGAADPVSSIHPAGGILLQGVAEGGSGNSDRIRVDGVNITLPADMKAPESGERIIVFAERDSNGDAIAREITVEKQEFMPVIDLPDGGDDKEKISGDGHGHGSAEDSSDEHESEQQSEHDEKEAVESESPESESPEAESPEMETPETESPEVESPEIESPEIEAPEIEAPEIEAPEIEVPEIEPVEVEPPEIEIPESGG